MTDKPDISIIIPSLHGISAPLEKKLLAQQGPAFEIISVTGVKPVARARNQGAARAQGKILVFMDDDAIPGNRHLLAAMFDTLEQAPDAGVVGPEERLPADSNRFQQRLAKERPRGEPADPHRPRETESGINTTCWALTAELFRQLGGFNQTMIAGDDYDFLYRARLRGKRHYLVPGTWVIHPPPPNFRTMLRKFYWYGMGDAQNTLLHPEWNFNVRLRGRCSRWLYILLRTLFVIPNMFVPISFKHREFCLHFRPLQAISSFAAACGYVRAWRQGTVKPWPPPSMTQPGSETRSTA